ncbi:hypothetical protein RhiirB3_455340, partial [Rhizophagus irregularis]
AAFYTNNEEGEYSVYSSLFLWPSSTRAEIVAIFLALLTAPENSNVTIYTDSLGAINSINSTFDSTTRKWLKKTNNLIIIKIIMLIRKASINIKLVKIKGHSGIIGNDIADKLAKNGQYGNNLFKNNVDFIDNILSYFPVFIDSPIEVNIRRFILKILATYEATEWSLLKNNQELLKVETCLTTKLQKDFKISLTEAQMLMANILIWFILTFKELLWKPRCEQVILWEKRKSITRTDKITIEPKIKDNLKDNLNQPSDKAKDIKIRKADQIQKSIPLVKKSMDTFIKKYICENWIPIKKKFDKVTLYISKKLLE